MRATGEPRRGHAHKHLAVKFEVLHLSFPKALLQELTSTEVQGLLANALEKDQKEVETSH